MTRSTIGIPALAIAVICLTFLSGSAGCDGTGEAVGPVDASSPEFNVHSPGASVPIAGRGTAILEMQQRAPGFGPPEFGRSDFGGRCSVPADLLQRFVLTGQARHLGRFTATLEHCTRIDFQAGRGEWGDGVSVFTAADGDQLWDTYTGRTAPSGQGFEDEIHVFAGGTGRFAGASGIGLFDGDCDQATGTCVFELEGFISYDASDRRP